MTKPFIVVFEHDDIRVIQICNTVEEVMDSIHNYKADCQFSVYETDGVNQADNSTLLFRGTLDS